MPYIPEVTNEELLSRLHDPNPDIRRDAANWLGLRREQRAVEPLILLLADPEVRVTAARVLGDLGNEQAIDPLIQMLNDEKLFLNWWECSNVIHALCQLQSPRAVEPILKYLSSDDDIVFSEAAWCLGQLKDKRATEPLLQHLKTKTTRSECIDIANALGYIKDEQAVNALIALLSHDDPYVWISAFWSLGEIRDKQAVAPIIALLQRQQPEQWHYELVSRSAVEALEKIGTPEAVAAVDAWRKKQQG